MKKQDENGEIEKVLNEDFIILKQPGIKPSALYNYDKDLVNGKDRFENWIYPSFN